MVRSFLFASFALALAATSVQAAPATLDVTAAPDCPLGAALLGELRATLASHLADGHAGLVQVRLELDRAELRVDGKARTIPVDDWRADTLVWVIAVHVMDLATPAPVLHAPPSAIAARRASGGGAGLSLGPRVSHGIDGTDPTSFDVELGADLAVGSVRVGAAVDWIHGMTHDAGTPQEASADLWPVRLRVGWSIGTLELLANGFLASYRVRANRDHAGLTFGGGAEARWHGKLGASMGWYVGAGVDVFARRTTFAVVSVVYSTPFVAPYLGAGLTVRILP